MTYLEVSDVAGIVFQQGGLMDRFILSDIRPILSSGDVSFEITILVTGGKTYIKMKAV